jgi:hypothetical protein
MVWSAQDRQAVRAQRERAGEALATIAKELRAAAFDLETVLHIVRMAPQRSARLASAISSVRADVEEIDAARA